MSAGWRYILLPRAQHDIERAPPQMRRRIFAALDRLAADRRRGDVRKLQGAAEWRLRVGDWRVRFEFDEPHETIVVLHVLPRGRAYRD